MISAIASLVSRPGFSIDRDIELALLRVGLDPRVLDALEAALFKKPWMAASGAPTPGPFSLLAQIGLGGRQADDMKRQAPRGDEALRALVDEIALDQRVGHEALQVLRRLPLHAGGDFFAEEFKQEVGHQSSLRERPGAKVQKRGLMPPRPPPS